MSWQCVQTGRGCLFHSQHWWGGISPPFLQAFCHCIPMELLRSSRRLERYCKWTCCQQLSWQKMSVILSFVITWYVYQSILLPENHFGCFAVWQSSLQTTTCADCDCQLSFQTMRWRWDAPTPTLPKRCYFDSCTNCCGWVLGYVRVPESCHC